MFQIFRKYTFRNNQMDVRRPLPSFPSEFRYSIHDKNYTDSDITVNNHINLIKDKKSEAFSDI